MDRATQILLLKNGFAGIPHAALAKVRAGNDAADTAALGTVLLNMSYFGYAPSCEMVETLTTLSTDGLTSFWEDIQPLLSEITADDRDMGAHVVYKNFPKEVLDKTHAEYWIAQILMYVGFPNPLFTESPESRAPMTEVFRPRILDLATPRVWQDLYARLTAVAASWLPDQVDAIREILTQRAPCSIDAGNYGFRANAIRAAVLAKRENIDATLSTTSATDILRLMAGLSAPLDTCIVDVDVEMKTAPRFAKLSRPQRRSVVNLLEACSSLETDFARHPEIWKRLLSLLHPGDFKVPCVSAAYKDLYEGSRNRMTARIESGYTSVDPIVLDLLSLDPGTFMRQLHRAYSVFGLPAFEKFVGTMSELTISQMINLDGYMSTISERCSFLVRPNGKWGKAQVIERTKAPIAADHLEWLRAEISHDVGTRLNKALPAGVDLDKSLNDVKLITNGQELAEYGRGTVFDIPKEMTFLRTASYWKNNSYEGTWFDNGWNFFGDNWAPIGSCCWNHEKLQINGQTCAVFSGDPTNSKDLEGRGCQMIDLYLDRLDAAGVRYAVWSVLCYSHISYSDADDVVASLQWGIDAQAGKLYEPSRAQMVFPLKGPDLTKFVAYIDVKSRKLVYMDAGFPAFISTAESNTDRLAKLMPGFQSYAESLPSIGSLFASAKRGTVPILRSDEDAVIDGQAYVFNRRSATNRVEQIDIEALLALKGVA
jgi:hypothetical protein